MWISINMDKVSLFHMFILQTVHTHFWPWPPKKMFNHLLICVKLYQHAKNQLISPVHSWDTFKFSPQTRLATCFFIMPNQKVLDQLLIFVNLYQHAKNKTVSTICAGKITVDLKIQQYGWLKAFWFYALGVRFFPNIGLLRNTAINITFHYRRDVKPFFQLHI